MAATRLVGILLVVGLVAAACGGSGRLSQEEYESEVRDITTRAGFAIEITSETPPREIPDRLDSAVENLRESSDQLAGLSPPEEAQEAHDLLVEGIDQLGDEIRQLREDVEGIDDPIELRKTVDNRRGVLPALAKIQEAQRQFNQLGYAF